MMKHIILSTVALSLLGAPAFAASDILKTPWNEIVTQAKKEGEVVWYSWFLLPRFRELTKAFTDKYGIKVIIPDGTVDGNISKFVAERGRSEGDIDVMSVPGDRLPQVDVKVSMLGPLDILPSYTKLRTKINGGDSQGYAVAYWGNQTGLAYDPTQVDETKLPQTFEELTVWIKENSQSFAFNDPRGGGAGNAFIQSVVRATTSKDNLTAGNYEASWDWFRSNRQDYGFTSSNADSLTRLNGGEFQIVAAWEDHLAGLQKSGEVDRRVKFYIPGFGMPGGGNAVGVAANAKHKAAALLFVDWLTSAETQDLFAREMGASPVNSDAKGVQGGVPPEQRAYSTEFLTIKDSDAVKNQFIEKIVLGQ